MICLQAADDKPHVHVKAQQLDAGSSCALDQQMGDLQLNTGDQLSVAAAMQDMSLVRSNH